MNLEPMAIVSPNLGWGRSAGEDGQRFQALLVNLGEARHLKIRNEDSRWVNLSAKLACQKPSMDDCTFSDKQISISKNSSFNFFPQSNKTVSGQ